MKAAIAELGLDGRDSAAVKLAEQYAATIDGAGWHCDGCDDDKCKKYNNSWAMRWIAPLLLDVLESIGATPNARKEKQAPAATGPNRLEQLRATRARA